jgi:hypothetical protein
MARKQTPAEGQPVTVTLTDDEDLYRPLREIEPHILDRVVDRFSRLTDSLLDE